MEKTPFISMLLGCALASGAVLAAWSQLAQAAPKSTSRIRISRVVKPSCDPPKGPGARGMRVNVHGIFRVTDSSDGVRDRQVEAYGFVDFNGQRVWTVQRKNAIKSGGGYMVSTDNRNFDVIFNDPSTWTLRVNGYVNDYDKGSDDDAMWNPRRRTRTLNLKQLFDSGYTLNQPKTYVLAGDRDSESADLTLSIGNPQYLF